MAVPEDVILENGNMMQRLHSCRQEEKMHENRKGISLSDDDLEFLNRSMSNIKNVAEESVLKLYIYSSG